MKAINRTPAEVFPVWHFIEQEMEARGWNISDLVNHMPADQALSRLTLAILREVGSVRLGEQTASDLAHAFGTSKELWLNLEAAWVEANK